MSHEARHPQASEPCSSEASPGFGAVYFNDSVPCTSGSGLDLSTLPVHALPGPVLYSSTGGIFYFQRVFNGSEKWPSRSADIAEKGTHMSATLSSTVYLSGLPYLSLIHEQGRFYEKLSRKNGFKSARCRGPPNSTGKTSYLGEIATVGADLWHGGELIETLEPTIDSMDTRARI